MLTARNIASIRLRIASRRPGGMLGNSFGQAAWSTTSALPVASLRSFRVARWVWSGSTVLAICPIGQSVNTGARLLQTSPIAVAPPATVLGVLARRLPEGAEGALGSEGALA